MATTDLTALMALISTLAIASQKLVDIVKAWIPWLSAPSQPSADPSADLQRQRWVQVIAGACGIATAWASTPALESLAIYQKFAAAGGLDKTLLIVVVGLLASGGSGPWNDLSTWLKNLKESSKLPTGGAK